MSITDGRDRSGVLTIAGESVDDRVLERVTADPAVRVLVLADVTGSTRWTAAALWAVPVPVVATIVGPVCDGRVLAADVAIAGESATFVCRRPLSAVDLFVWQQSIGVVRARWLALTGEQIDARAAYEWGAVGEIARDDDLAERAARLAVGLADGHLTDRGTQRTVVGDRYSTARRWERRPHP